MTEPSPKYAGFAHHCIFRFKQGRYYVVPTRAFIDAFLTILGRALDDYGMCVASWSLMGTHIHIVVFDRSPFTLISKVDPFVQFVGSTFAKWLNWKWDLRGCVISPDVQTQAIAVLDSDAELSTATYVGLNPVSAGIVADPAQHEGATSIPEFLLEPIVVDRPDGWFSKRKWPERAEIKLDVPPRSSAHGMTRTCWFKAWKANQEFARAAILLDRASAGKSNDGLEWARQQSPLEPKDDLVSYRKIPFCGSIKEMLAKMFEQLRRFRGRYRAARNAVLDSEMAVTFPVGTSRMASSFGFPVEPG